MRLAAPSAAGAPRRTSCAKASSSPFRERSTTATASGRACPTGPDASIRLADLGTTLQEPVEGAPGGVGRVVDARLETLDFLLLLGSQDRINLRADPCEQQGRVPLSLPHLCCRGANGAFVGGLRHHGIVKSAACGCGSLHLSLDLVGVRSEHVLDPGVLVVRQVEGSRHAAEEALREVSASLPSVK